jgi:hypothetical protein
MCPANAKSDYTMGWICKPAILVCCCRCISRFRMHKHQLLQYNYSMNRSRDEIQRAYWTHKKRACRGFRKQDLQQLPRLGLMVANQAHYTLSKKVNNACSSRSSTKDVVFIKTLGSATLWITITKQQGTIQLQHSCSSAQIEGMSSKRLCCVCLHNLLLICSIICHIESPMSKPHDMQPMDALTDFNWIPTNQFNRQDSRNNQTKNALHLSPTSNAARSEIQYQGIRKHCYRPMPHRHTFNMANNLFITFWTEAWQSAFSRVHHGITSSHLRWVSPTLHVLLNAWNGNTCKHSISMYCMHPSTSTKRRYSRVQKQALQPGSKHLLLLFSMKKSYCICQVSANVFAIYHQSWYRVCYCKT